jgi:hypothetical protein
MSHIYLQADAQAILNKYMDAQQQADLLTKSQYLYNLVQQGALTEKQVQTEIQRALQIAAQTQGQKISNKIASDTANALISATNMAYYTQYYDSLWDYKNVNHRKNLQFSKDKAIRDYYKWSAGNAKKDFDSYGLRNAIKIILSSINDRIDFRLNLRIDIFTFIECLTLLKKSKGRS